MRANFQQEPGAGLAREDYTRPQELEGREAQLKPKPRSALPSWGREDRSKAGGSCWDRGCRRPAWHHPKAQLLVTVLSISRPMLWALALGTEGWQERLICLSPGVHGSCHPPGTPGGKLHWQRLRAAQ